MSQTSEDLESFLQRRKQELEKQLAPYESLKSELEKVVKALKVLKGPKKKVSKKKTCTGCYHSDWQTGDWSGGCDVCRQGPHYR